MNIFPNRPQAYKVTFEADSFSVYLADGRILNVPLVFFPRLLNATPEERTHYEIGGGGTGLHWDDLDEDISVEGLLLGVGDRISSHKPDHKKRSA